MRKMFVSLFVALLLASSVLASTTTIDLGTPAGEAGVTINSWGPVEPTTHLGGWGGIGGSENYDSSTTVSADGLCRTIWGYDEGVSGNDASIM